MKKAKSDRTIDAIIFLMIFIAFILSAIAFLSDENYTTSIEVLLTILGIATGTAIISLLTQANRGRKIRKVFIIYSQEDTNFVSRLYNALKVTPYKILWDKKEIKVGDNIEEKLDRLLLESDDTIFVISESSMSPDFPKEGLTKAAKLKKRILPVLIDHSEPPEELKEIMFADFRSSFDDGYFSLRDALKAKPQDDATPQPDKPVSD